MEENDDWFLNKSIRESNESLRVGPGPENDILGPENDILGIEGSFRQLTVD